MSRILSLVTLVGLFALLLAGLAPAPAAARGAPEPFVSGEILVKFRDGSSGLSRTDAHKGTRGVVRRTIPRINVDVVAVTPGQENSRLAEYLRNPNVEYAERNGVYAAVAAPNDPRVTQQWHLENGGQNSGIADADIDAFAAWDVTRGTSAVAVAILDTGIDQQHPDLAGKVQKTANFSGAASDQDVNGHGTHVAGIVAASTDNGVGVAGVCPSCVLYNVKVLGDDGNGSWANIASGINWAVDNGAKVINLSLGGSAGSQTLASAINNAWSKGVVVVAAAGNNSSNAAFYPAYYPNVIAVASTNNRDQKSSYSNYGTWINVAAPGESILSTTRGGNYGLMSGTSMASPVVAGLAGLLWSTSWGTSNANVRARLEGTTEAIGGTGTSWSNGRINACMAVGGACGGAANGPTVTLVSPASGAVMNDDGSSQRLQLRTDDTTTPEGALSVQFRVDGGVWNSASYNQSRKLYEWSWSLGSVATGVHAVDARATNGAGGTTISSPAAVRVTRAVSIPSAFEAEDYYRFSDLSAGNSGGAYWADDVDKQTCSDGAGCVAITDIESGEWLSYRIDNPNEGDYIFTFRVATPQSNATITALVDDVDVSGAISVASTGGWATWDDRASSPVHLPAGAHTLKLRFGHIGANPGMLMNLNSVSITPDGIVGTPPPPPPPSDPPSVSLSSPTPGTTLGGAVSVTANASGDNGVSHVEFFVDGASIGIDTSPADGWSATWNSATVSDGARVLTAMATDTAGQSTTSEQVIVTVKNVNQPPVASFTTSCSDLACAFDASASRDPDGTIVSYAWTFGDGVSGAGTSIGRTYSKAGTYTVFLTVTDDAGSTATTSRNVTVTAPPPPAPPTVHIGDLDGSLKINARTGGTATVTILAESSVGDKVANATVTGTFTYTGASRSVSCKTGATGTCTVTLQSIPTRVTSVTFTVTKVTHATLAYKPADNRDPDGDSNGTTIVLRQ